MASPTTMSLAFKKVQDISWNLPTTMAIICMSSCVAGFEKFGVLGEFFVHTTLQLHESEQFAFMRAQATSAKLTFTQTEHLSSSTTKAYSTSKFFYRAAIWGFLGLCWAMFSVALEITKSANVKSGRIFIDDIKKLCPISDKKMMSLYGDFLDIAMSNFYDGGFSKLLIQILKSEEFYSIAEQLSITLMANTSKSVLAESLDMEVGEFDAACNAQIHSGLANGAGLLGQVMSFLVRMVVWLNLSSVGETKLSDYLQFSRFVKYTAYYTSGDKTQSKIVEATTDTGPLHSSVYASLAMLLSICTVVSIYKLAFLVFRDLNVLWHAYKLKRFLNAGATASDKTKTWPQLVKLANKIGFENFSLHRKVSECGASEHLTTALFLNAFQEKGGWTITQSYKFGNNTINQGEEM